MDTESLAPTAVILPPGNHDGLMIHWWSAGTVYDAHIYECDDRGRDNDRSIVIILDPCFGMRHHGHHQDKGGQQRSAFKSSHSGPPVRCCANAVVSTHIG